MVFFFLIPSIPAVLGNFLIPLMIGAKDRGVPEDQPAELVYLHARRRVCHCTSLLTGRRRYRLDLLHAVQHFLFKRLRDCGRAGNFHQRLFVDPHRAEFHRHHPPHARARADLVPAAAVRVGALRDQHDSGSGNAGDRGDALPAGAGARTAHRILRSRLWRRSGAVPAHVLVLLAPGGLHHDSAVDGRGHRNHLDVQFEEAVRIYVHRVFERGDRGVRIPRLGASPVRQQPVGLCRHGVFDPELRRRDPVGDQSLQLDRDDVQRLGPADDADALCARVSSDCSRSAA